MIRYQCTQCDKKFTSAEYDALERQQLYPEQDDPYNQGGFEKVCDACGAGMHSDKWHLVDTAVIDEEQLTVSTVGLTISHGLDDDLWFETMIRHPYGSKIIERYHSKIEAREGHSRILSTVRDGEFQWVSTGRQIELLDW